MRGATWIGRWLVIAFLSPTSSRQTGTTEDQASAGFENAHTIHSRHARSLWINCRNRVSAKVGSSKDKIAGSGERRSRPGFQRKIKARRTVVGHTGSIQRISPCRSLKIRGKPLIHPARFPAAVFLIIIRRRNIVPMLIKGNGPVMLPHINLKLAGSPAAFPAVISVAQAKVAF